MEDKKEKPTLERWHGAHLYSDKIHIVFVLFLIFSAILILWSYFSINKIEEKVSEKPSPTQSVGKPEVPGGGVACTMEAKACPDGVNFVGRTGPNCEFQACPDEHCGGNIKNAKTCLSGYHCQLSQSNPDAGGTCVKD